MLEKALLFQKDDQSLPKALGKGWSGQLQCLEGFRVTGGGKGWDDCPLAPLSGFKPNFLISFFGAGILSLVDFGGLKLAGSACADMRVGFASLSIG